MLSTPKQGCTTESDYPYTGTVWTLTFLFEHKYCGWVLSKQKEKGVDYQNGNAKWHTQL